MALAVGNENLPPTLPGFAARFRRARRSAGIKQDALALEFGVDQATVSRWERGVQAPSCEMQQMVLATLYRERPDDSALKRLVSSSRDNVHLIDDASHTCLAYSERRAREWETSARGLLGECLWRFATDEIQEAEAALEESDWWSAALPAPRTFQTSALRHEELIIHSGWISWERLYLSDGTPVRLVTSA